MTPGRVADRCDPVEVEAILVGPTREVVDGCGDVDQGLGKPTTATDAAVLDVPHRGATFEERRDQRLHQVEFVPLPPEAAVHQHDDRRRRAVRCRRKGEVAEGVGQIPVGETDGVGHRADGSESARSSVVDVTTSGRSLAIATAIVTLVLGACATATTSTAPAGTTAQGEANPSDTADPSPALTTTTSTLAATTSSLAPAASTAPVTSPATTTTSTSASTSTTLVPTTTVSAIERLAPLDPTFTETSALFDALAANNLGAAVSIAHRGDIVFERAAGPTVDGDAATAWSPMVVASVSKLTTSLAVGRLAELGVIDLDAPVPWEAMGIPTHPAWRDVTPNELLGHAAGMPVARSDWFVWGGGTCRQFLPTLLVDPPTATRGEWEYANGNYCALGLLIEHVTEQPVADAVDGIVFDPLGLGGLHATVNGLLDTDLAHPRPVDRLIRLGAAGTFVVSMNDLAAALSQLSPDDLAHLRRPAAYSDQYGVGHTGTIRGAKACAWSLDEGATAIAIAISGDSISSGGRLCDLALPALARDLGVADPEPRRFP